MNINQNFKRLSFDTFGNSVKVVYHEKPLYKIKIFLEVGGAFGVVSVSMLLHNVLNYFLLNLSLFNNFISVTLILTANIALNKDFMKNYHFTFEMSYSISTPPP